MTTKNQKLRVVNLLLILFLIPGLLGLSSVQTVLAAGRLAVPAVKNDIPPVADIANFSILPVTVLEPLGYWKFDESSWAGDCSTADMLDSSGNNRHGTACINGDAPFPVPGKFGNAGQFDGINQYANMGPGFNFTSSFTAAMWIALDDYDWCGPTGKSQHIIGTHDLKTPTGNGRGWGIYWDCDGLAWELTNSTGSAIGSYGYVQPSPFPANGSWHHVALVYDSTVPSATLYWDGVAVHSESGTENVPSFLFNNGEPLTVNGLPYAPSSGAPGKIDDTRVFNSALSAAEIQTLFDNQPPVAVEDAYSTDQDTVLNVTAPGVLGNDSDPNGNPITAVKVNDPANGTLSLDANGSFTYTPNPGFSGSDTFTYKASDNLLQSSVASVGILVNAIPVPTEPVIHYVKWNAVGADDGASWTDAFTDLQSALAAVSSGDEIWVAVGTYKPTTGTDRSVSFVLKNGVAVYGGFAGTETSLTQRDHKTNVTVLSGDIGVNGNNSDNSYHVVVGSHTSNSAVLDGFTITKGNADDLFDPDASGGGMHILEGSPGLKNLIFTANMAKSGGGIALDISNSVLVNIIFQDNSAESAGGILVTAGTPTLRNVTVSGNTALFYGGGMGISNSSPILENVTFYGNMADTGAGMYTYGNPVLKNVSFSGNIANAIGGGLYNESSNPTIINSIFWNNMGGEIENFDENTPSVSYSIVQGGYPGIGNINEDPLLGPLQDNGGFTQTMALGAGSPAVDAGDDANCPAEDQRGVTRPQGSHCDIGAYELEQGGSLPTSPTFTDVPSSHPYWEDIEILYANGLTAGCTTSPLKFCPDQIMDRAQAAVFMLRGNFGTSYTPPTVVKHIFADNWTPGLWAEKWAEGMYNANLTAGCTTSGPLKFCPWEQMPREQVVIFGLKLKYGKDYNPPAATGTVFADMTDTGYYATKWAEQAYKDGLLPACGTSGGKPMFCPKELVSRGLGANIIVKAKDLSMP